jgi:indole-3-glycerol phosphate synthase
MNRTNILEQIVSYKKQEISRGKSQRPVSFLERQPSYQREIFSMKKMLVDPAKTGIIAEFKKRSPSKGIINDRSVPEEVTKAYARYGASVISVLTDTPSFGGSEADLQSARVNKLPILRKDFILDPYQIVESRAMGADAILLIAACLSASETKSLAKTAHQIGLEVLLEIHEERELDHFCDDVDVVGINNRDLKTFVVDVENSIRLSKQLPTNILRIAESGIRDVETILLLKAAGFDGFLIGEQFMRAADPAIAFANFVDQLKNKLYENKSLRHDATRSGEETR